MLTIKEIVNSIYRIGVAVGTDANNYAEEITGVSFGMLCYSRMNFGNELLHSLFSIMTAILSGYIVHKLKMSNFNFKRMIDKFIKRKSKRKL